MTFQRSFLILVLSLISISGLSQEYYVVIGAFAKEDNAKKFTGYAHSKYLDAYYRKKPANNIYYVFVLATTNKEEAYARAKLLREETEFKDAWSFFGQLDNWEPGLTENKPAHEPINNPSQQPSIAVEEKKPEPEVVDQKDNVAVPINVPDNKGLAQPKGRYFKYVISTAQETNVPGQVHHVDRVRGRDIATYPANEYVDVVKPSGNNNNAMTIVCGIFGYKEVVKIINYDDPSVTEGAYQDGQGAWVIPFPLDRLSKGDASVMYHVSFFKDAVVMLKESKTEMDELVTMMQINPAIIIKVHGHCNGNNERRIIALGATKNYFDVNGSDERKGSAKELSNLRAEAVRSYLVDHGIEKSRIKTYAWGGLNMLVDENSPSAKLNDRIEIEILED